MLSQKQLIIEVVLSDLMRYMKDHGVYTREAYRTDYKAIQDSLKSKSFEELDDSYGHLIQ